MRNILLLLLLSLTMITKAQDSTYVKLDTSSINIDNALTVIVLDNFVRDACKYGLDSNRVVNHITDLDAIYISDSLSDKLGVTIYVTDSLSPIEIRGIIFINSDLLTDYSIYQITLYHELGHWFGLDHKNGIMSKNSKNIYKILNKWDKNVERLMKKIKKLNYSYPIH